MAIQGFDPGGEFYFSSGISAPSIWTTTGGSVSLASNAPTGRLTQYAITVSTNGSFDKVLSGNFVTFVQAGAYCITAGALFANTIMVFLDGTNTQVDLRVDASGHLFVTRNGTTLGTSTNTVSTNQGWIYVEFQATIDGAVGAAQVWVNGVSWLNLTGVNTKATANAFMNRVRYGSSIINAQNCYWKDLYWLDTGTGANTSRLGDIQVTVIFPNLAGPSQSWTNNGGASQTVSVQDGIGHTGTWPDGDTTYISDSVSGHISDFNHQAIGTGTIFGIGHVSYVRSDAGAANFQQYTNSSGTVHTTANLSAGGSYNYFIDIEETDPATSAQWTPTGFNAATLGVKIP